MKKQTPDPTEHKMLKNKKLFERLTNHFMKSRYYLYMPLVGRKVGRKVGRTQEH